MRNFPRLSSKSMGILVEKLKKKAEQSPSKTRIAALAFDCHGEFIAQAFNTIPPDGVSLGKGAGQHAEARLMRKYRPLVKTIIISRIGRGGDWLPIQPCEKCKALAEKLGINIVAIDECE